MHVHPSASLSRPVAVAGTLWRELWRLALLAAAYYVAARVGLLYGTAHGNISPVWPASGVAIAGVLTWGLRVWPAVALGNGLAVLGTEASLSATLASAGAATVETLLAGLLLRWAVGQRLPFYRVLDLVRFVVLAGVLATGVGAAVGVSGMTLGGVGWWQAFDRLWVSWWLGDMMGVLWVAPVFLTLADGRRIPWNRVLAAQAVLIAVLIVALGAVVFREPWPDLTGYTNPLTFVTVPLIVWATFTFGQKGATLSTLLTGGMAIWGSGEGYGPFAHGTFSDSFFLLQTYLAINAVSAQLLGAVLSEFRMTREELQALNDSLEARVQARTNELAFLSRQRNAFYALVTHDLKGMIASLLGYAGILRQDHAGTDETALREVGTYTWELGHRLHGLLDNLFQWSTVQMEEAAPQAEPLDVQALLHGVREFFAPVAERKGVALRLSAGPCRACADRRMTESVVRNLVSNAVKFTAAGGTVTLSAEGRGEGAGGGVRIVVRDTGVGMEPEHLGRLFRFEERVSRAGTEGEKGTGLGLLLCRELVEHQGGTLAIDSTPGAGTACTVTLPAAARAIPGA